VAGLANYCNIRFALQNAAQAVAEERVIVTTMHLMDIMSICRTEISLRFQCSFVFQCELRNSLPANASPHCAAPLAPSGTAQSQFHGPVHQIPSAKSVAVAYLCSC